MSSTNIDQPSSQGEPSVENNLLIVTLADLSRYSIPVSKIAELYAGKMEGTGAISSAKAVLAGFSADPSLVIETTLAMRWPELEPIATRLPDAKMGPLPPESLWQAVDMEIVGAEGEAEKTDRLDPRTLGSMLKIICDL